MGKDYRSLAGKMGLSHKQVKNIDITANPTEELLEIWMSGRGSKTVTDLIELLRQIERYDAIRSLEKHEYTLNTNGNGLLYIYFSLQPLLYYSLLY